MHALLEGRYELAWVPVEEIRVGDLLLKGGNLVRRVQKVKGVLLDEHRFAVSRAESDTVLGDWFIRKGGGMLVLRDVTAVSEGDRVSLAQRLMDSDRWVDPHVSEDAIALLRQRLSRAEPKGELSRRLPKCAWCISHHRPGECRLELVDA